MATPTEALVNLNKINERYLFIKQEIYKLLDEENKIREKINNYLIEIEEMENNYVDLMGDLTQNKTNDI